MLWTDLEIGDKIKFKDDFVEDIKNANYTRWANYWCGRILEIEYININSIISIIICNQVNMSAWNNNFSITLDGLSTNLPSDKIVFEIIELNNN
jgi:hypothetical protein